MSNIDGCVIGRGSGWKRQAWKKACLVKIVWKWRSLEPIILSSTSFQSVDTFWEVLSAAVEKPKCKTNKAAQGDGKKDDINGPSLKNCGPFVKFSRHSRATIFYKIVKRLDRKKVPLFYVEKVSPASILTLGWQGKIVFSYHWNNFWSQNVTIELVKNMIALPSSSPWVKICKVY